MVPPLCSETVNLDDPILAHARKDYPSLRQDMTIQEALATIRKVGIGERIIYFYVLDENERLVGVMPTRRLLTAELDKPLSEVMIGNVVSIPDTATVLETCEFFVKNKFLAFPVVDQQQRMAGIVDVSLFTEEVFDLAERQQSDTIFESIGFRIEQVRNVSPVKAFYFRFPWLLATITSGTFCALLASIYEVTLAQALALAFFLTLVLGLGESVSIQSMTVTLQILRNLQPSIRWYARALRHEALTAVLLGTMCGSLVGLIAWIWRGDWLVALAIGSGILLSICAACLIGISVPALLHALKLDPKVACGPITLALADIFTLLCYFTMAMVLL
ncbi:MAG: magnesium transporter MgtE [Planctomycetes bacterium RBG_13_46_10]|nr:MAG: magnesium transporter MgtE [Planctomycetes bacterium RBG_13_46_10]